MSTFIHVIRNSKEVRAEARRIAIPHHFGRSRPHRKNPKVTSNYEFIRNAPSQNSISITASLCESACRRSELRTQRPEGSHVRLFRTERQILSEARPLTVLSIRSVGCDAIYLIVLVNIVSELVMSMFGILETSFALNSSVVL